MQELVHSARQYASKWLGTGQVADYIPELSHTDPGQLGICITDLNGNAYSAGETRSVFTMQSMAKLIVLAAALRDSGFERVFSIVGMEPSGDPFNSIVRLETALGKPMNPMINAGAIAIVSCLSGKTPAERFQRVLQYARTLLDDSGAACDESVYASEKETGDRNRALAYMMRAAGIVSEPVEELLEVHFRISSITATCESISFFGAVLANNGVSPRNGAVLIDPFSVRVIRSLMTTCGMYDASGEFALRIGIPAKSGVSGGVVAAAPDRMGIGVFSPALDNKGNSICGVKALEFLSNYLQLSIF